ncbi:BQ2448_5217 [Microbotryum intermedium]|uniref:BQ2448_5217 protein n=1 Tax=Microbotryum intermedium TaxID=269621 RepID=A0A238F965_9BASI|nr:BQ2448_5217 [Microbotryum intermedium]
MLERAGVLQRPRCYPHPGALPPKYQFVNYYAPARPMERMAHFSPFSLNREPDTTIRIIAGDLNDCPNLAVDRKSVSPGPRPASHATHWRTLIGRIPYSVIDTIRYLHPHARQFSRPHRQKGHAHLLVSGTTSVDAPLSDHRPVSVTIACPSAESSTAVPSLPETSSQLFRVNTRVSADEAFAARIPFIINASRRSHPLDPLAAFEEAMARLKIASSDHARHLNRQFLTMKAALERRTHELEALPVLDDQRRAEWQDSVSMNKRLILERARQLRIRAHIPELSSEEPLSHTVHARLAGRRTTIKIDALRLADESISTDLVKCLEHIQTHFQSHHTPDDRDVAQVEDARSTLLDPVRSALPRSTKHSDSRFMRPMTQRHSKLLEEPFTADEFVEAIGKTDKGRSPGASGLPYEMYQSSPTVFAELIASTCNEAWTKGALPDSMTSGIVRLLKKPKPDADYTNLKYYRPITLRECSYKLMSKVLVARLNKVLPSVLPPSQHGFMPGRKASDAGSHLSLLLEQIRTLDLADSALLSLDQESAYDLVDHDWIISVFRAIGAPERFLGLLGVIYGSVSLRYIINGYLTGVVHMLCGLGQRDPVSCPIWNVCFQPYLDALVRRKIALDLCAVLLPTRATILTHLAFADDAIVLVSSPAALGLLAGLAVDWRLAVSRSWLVPPALVAGLGSVNQTETSLPTVIIMGILTLLAGALAFFCVSDVPAKAKWLTEDERAWLVWRKASDGSSVGEAEGLHVAQIKSAFTDYHCWVALFFYISILVPLYSVGLFAPTLINSFGKWTRAEVQLLTVPMYVFACSYVLISSVYADRYRTRFLFLLAAQILCLIGFTINIIPTAPVGVKFFGLFLCAAGAYGGVPSMISWLSTNLSGTTKRAVGTGLTLGIASLGGIVSSNVYRRVDAPNYLLGHGVLIATSVMGIISSCLYAFLLKRSNEAKDRWHAEQNALPEDQRKVFTVQELRDMGDRAPEFYYTI